MSGSPDPQKRRLVADTETPGTEIIVSDGLGRVVERAAGRLDAALMPGLYKLRFRVGAEVRDQLIELPEGSEPFTVHTPQLPFETAVPITRRESGVSPNAAHAVSLSTAAPEAFGAGSQLLVFVDTPGTDILPSIELHGFDRGLVALVTQESAEASFAGGLFALDPGSYLLRCGTVEQTVVTCRGWQTQVYLSSPAGDDAPDLTDAAILMSRLGNAFDPDDPGFRAAEVARRALKARRWRAADDPNLAPFLLDERFDNPILGIFAAHLMLMADPVDAAQLKAVVGSLDRLIGGHPDVASLYHAIDDPRAAETRFGSPPMLRSSWQQIIKAEAEGKVGVPPGSYAARIAAGLWGDGAWLTWTVPADAAMVVPGGDTMQQNLVRILALIRSGRLDRTPDGLTPAEQTIVRFVRSMMNQAEWAGMLTRVADEAGRFSTLMPLVRQFVPSPIQDSVKQMIDAAQSPENLVKLTGLPMASIGSAADSLSRKLGLEPGADLLGWIAALPGGLRTAASALGLGSSNPPKPGA